MSEICCTDNGWLIDHQDLVKQWYQNCTLTTSGLLTDNKILTTCSFQLKDVLFEINTPYMMESEFNGLHQASRSGKKRKKKKNKQTVEDNGDCKTIKRITDTYKELICLAQKKGYFTTETGIIDNNKSARQAAKIIGASDKLLDKIESEAIMTKPSVVISNSEDIKSVSRNIQVNQMVHYTGNKPIEITIYDDKYLLPPDSTFILSDWKQLLTMNIAGDKCFDLVVVDPPWQNKSVKRKKSYNTVWEDTLLQFSLNDIITRECIVVIWVTNKPRLHSFIKDTLLPKWNITYCLEWNWLKVTRSGDMICDITTSTKKPYETLFVSQLNRHTERPSLPNHQTIISIPCSLHSKKPPLSEIFKSYLPQNPKCLELFGRNLQPGWTSWGNEVIKHQHMDFFDICST